MTLTTLSEASTIDGLKEQKTETGDNERFCPGCVPGDAPRSISDLPTELFEEIFLWAKLGQNTPTRRLDDYDDPNVFSQNEEYPLFKSLRLVCRRLRDVATPRLFHTVVLLYHDKSWGHLNNIALSSHLAPHVRIVQVATVARLLYPLHAYGELLEGWWNVSQPSEMALTTRPNGGRFAKIRNDRSRCFEAYKRWHDGEQAMAQLHAVLCECEGGVTDLIPRLYLNRLPRLRRVETIGHYELAVVKRKKSDCMGHGRWLLNGNRSRREMETMIIDSSLDEFDPSENLDLFLAAAQYCGLIWDTFTIRRVQDLLTGSFATYSRTMRRLELDFQQPQWRMLRPLPEDFQLASWVRTLDNLEELSVVMPHVREHTCYFDPLILLTDVTFPRLRLLSLKRESIEQDSLVHFTERHRLTLRRMRFDIVDQLPYDPSLPLKNPSILSSFFQKLRQSVSEDFQGQKTECNSCQCIV